MRRKRATEARLLDAALAVFCERGYDGATTGEMARVADVAAGTFYLHFRDKRAAYEKLASRTAHELLERWRDALPASASRPERVRMALELTAQYWREHLDLAHLLLEGGPSLGSETHLRFVDEIAAIFAEAPEAVGDFATSRAYALLAAGLGIELGRLVVGEAPAGTDAALDEQIRRLIALTPPRTG